MILSAIQLKKYNIKITITIKKERITLPQIQYHLQTILLRAAWFL